MINIFNINDKLNSILNSVTLFSKKKTIDTKKLPSLGLFYPNDFTLKIKKATLEDIQTYNTNFKKDILVVLTNIKMIVKKNVILSKSYTINDIKAIDVMYIFFEIVRWSMDKNDIEVKIGNKTTEFISNFHYFQLPKEYIENYIPTEHQFTIEGWKFSLPAIGIESSITEFLTIKSVLGLGNNYEGKNWNFMYFVHDKSKLTDEEIENLLVIFNDDMSKEDRIITDGIVDSFKGFLRYHVMYKNQSVPIDNNINLETIWS